jgi:hypothetical protein
MVTLTTLTMEMIMTTTLKSNTENLVSRIKSGNDKIWSVYNAALSIDLNKETERFDREMDRVSNAIPRLAYLVQELQLMGYRDCLYPENRPCKKPDQWCWACPAEGW